jgi:hypothetical protein
MAYAVNTRNIDGIDASGNNRLFRQKHTEQSYRGFYFQIISYISLLNVTFIS